MTQPAAKRQSTDDTADCDVSQKYITKTSLVKNAARNLEGKEFSEFISTYLIFLCNILRRHIIFTGFRPKCKEGNKFRGCHIIFPDGNQEEIIEELNPQIIEVCRDFLNRKVTPEFLAKIHATHARKAAAGHHFSVRSTLQYMFTNQLKKNRNENIFVKFTDKNSIELYLRDVRRTMTHPLPPHPAEIRELLRKFRIMLTRLAGKGNISVYPTPYECYCLYYDCFGRNHREVIGKYAVRPAERRKLEKFEEWNDEAVSALLACHYRGATQIMNRRKVSCERRTVNNRRREYQKLLEDCLKKYVPDAAPEEIKLMLCKRNPNEDDVDTIMELFQQIVSNSGIDRSYSATRTLEKL